jgi:ThiF family protein
MTRSGDRHLRSDPEGRLKGLRPGHRRVVVRAHPEYVPECSAQHLLQMLINLLARQYGVVDEIVIDVPPVQAHDNVFLLKPEPGDLRQNLLRLGQIIAGPEIDIGFTTAKTDVAYADSETFTILVGPFDPGQEPNPAVAVMADGWRFECVSSRLINHPPSTSANPAGPYLGACFAAGSTFKYFYHLNHSIDLSHSLWDWVTNLWSDLPMGEEPTAVCLPTVYMIGGGAAGASCAFTLAATPQLSGYMPTIDPQSADETSRNRLISAVYEDVDQPKVLLIKQLFTKSSLQVIQYKGRWPDYTADPDRETPNEIRAIERTDRYEWVLSCVDRNIHRRNIAIYMPRHAIGGSTEGFNAQVSYYSFSNSAPCLGCYHPVPKELPTEELRQQLIAMSPAERLNWYKDRDADARTIAALEEYLIDPDCGHAGAAELARLGREGETDWSVGFVSVAAGVIQASMLLQLTMRGVPKTIECGTELYAWFANPDVARSRASRREDCDICGDLTRQRRFAQLWTLP